MGDVVGMLLFPCWMVGTRCRIVGLCLLTSLLIKPFLLMRKRLLDVFACKLN